LDNNFVWSFALRLDQLLTIAPDLHQAGFLPSFDSPSYSRQRGKRCYRSTPLNLIINPRLRHNVTRRPAQLLSHANQSCVVEVITFRREYERPPCPRPKGATDAEVRQLPMHLVSSCFHIQRVGFEDYLPVISSNPQQRCHCLSILDVNKMSSSPGRPPDATAKAPGPLRPPRRGAPLALVRLFATSSELPGNAAAAGTQMLQTWNESKTPDMANADHLLLAGPGILQPSPRCRHVLPL
jgi:hypothetical protein